MSTYCVISKTEIMNLTVKDVCSLNRICRSVLINKYILLLSSMFNDFSQRIQFLHRNISKLIVGDDRQMKLMYHLCLCFSKQWRNRQLIKWKNRRDNIWATSVLEFQEAGGLNRNRREKTGCGLLYVYVWLVSVGLKTGRDDISQLSCRLPFWHRTFCH